MYTFILCIFIDRFPPPPIDLPCARPYSTHWGLSSEQNRQKSLPHSGSIACVPISLTVGLERQSQISGFSL